MTEGAPQDFTNREIQNIVHPKPKENFGTAIKRKVAAGVAAFTIATGVGATATGCEAKFIPTETIESTVESSETTEQSVTVTPTETSVKVDPIVVTQTTETTSAPTETTVETTAPTETDVTIEQKLQMAPEIEGAEKVIKEINGLERVTYERDGEYIGEYKKEVTQTDENGETTETGAVMLIPSEVEKLLNEQIPTSKNGYLMPLAADLADINDLDNVNLTVGSKGFIVDGPYTIQIDCNDDQVDVLNIIPGKTAISESYSTDVDSITIQSQLNWDVDETDYNNKLAFLTVYGNYSKATNTISEDNELVFGERTITRNSGLISQTMGCANLIPDAQSFENLLKIDGVLVGLTNNNQ